MGKRLSSVIMKKSDASKELFTAFVRRDSVKLHINKNLYTHADLVAETVGYYAFAHFFLYILTLVF